MSADFPTTPGAYDRTFGGTQPGDRDAYIAKLSPAGDMLLFSTLLGGSNDDSATGMALDSSGNIYVVGSTNSADFPTTNGAAQTARSGGFDAFIAKLDPAGGSLLYATFLGGSLTENGLAIAIDSAGSAYVTGFTYSSNFPTTPGSLDTSLSGTWDAFVAKLNPSGSSIVYGTFLGGLDIDTGLALAVDGSGAAYVGGVTNTMAMTAGAFDTTYNGAGDAFLAKLNPAGDALAYATYLGGGDWDQISSIVLDSTGNSYVTGYTRSTNFPTTTGSFTTTGKGASDAFVAKVKPDGSGLVYSTLIGGSSLDQGNSIVLDASGNPIITGTTSSNDFPTTVGAFDTSFSTVAQDEDAFVAKLSSDATSLVYSTFLGGEWLDTGWAIALGTNSDVYIAGDTSSTNFTTTTNAFDTSFGGTRYESDAFAARMTLQVAQPPNNNLPSLPVLLLWIFIPAAIGVAIAASLLVYMKKRKRTPEQNQISSS
jgi:hypothetical protein